MNNNEGTSIKIIEISSPNSSHVFNRMMHLEELSRRWNENSRGQYYYIDLNVDQNGVFRLSLYMTMDLSSLNITNDQNNKETYQYQEHQEDENQKRDLS